MILKDKRKKVFIFLITLLVTVISAQKVSAISGASNYFPDTSPDNQGRSYALVQVIGTNATDRDVYMKARTTIANIYVPENMVNETINLNIINACHGTTRDSEDVWFGNTQFYVLNATTLESSSPVYVVDKKGKNNPSCTGTNKNIPISFTAKAVNAASSFYKISKVYDKGIAYNVYQFVANGIMAETGSSKRYLNAFGLESNDPRVLVGISNAPFACNNNDYKISCPRQRYYENEYTLGSTRSFVYSSFYGPSPASLLPSYSQRIKINSICSTKGGISFYDLDANDASLKNQKNLEIKLLKNGVPQYLQTLNGDSLGSISKTGIENWESGIPNILRAHPGFGGNNDQYLDIPGGDPMFEDVSKFEAGINYEMQINNIDSNNAIQILPSLVNCTPPLSAFDIADCSVLAGWTFDPDVSDESLKVHVYVDGPADNGGVFVGEYSADDERDDVNSDYGIKGRHGFNISLPSTYRNSKTHKFYLYAIGLNIFKEQDGVNSFIGEKSVGPCSSVSSVKCSIGNMTVRPSQPTTISMDIILEDVSGNIGVIPSISINNESYSNPELSFSSDNLSQTSKFTNIKLLEPGDFVVSGTASWSGESVECNGVVRVVLDGECSIADVLVEPNEPVSINMTLVFSDLYSSVTVTPSIRTNNSLYSNPLITLNGLSSSQESIFYNIIYTSLGEYEISGTASWNGGFTTCSGTARVVRKPFFKVENSDIMVGGVYSTSPCVAPSSTTFGNVFSWSTPLLDIGSSSDYVAKIFGKVQEMYSANSFSAPTDNSMQRRWLTIANNDAINSWGGGSGDVTCMKDIYANTIRTNPETITAASYTPGSLTPASKQILRNGNLTLKGVNNFTGTQAIYVTGNVYIDGNITMNSYTTTDTIPFFALIVKGDIYIDPSVTRLEGMYVAQPNESSGGGVIYTCGTSLYSAVAKGSVFGTCNKNLTFRGIVQAKELKLHRTYETLRTNNPAEVFDHSPELYLAPKPFRDDSDSTVQYDSAVSLPPLL